MAPDANVSSIFLLHLLVLEKLGPKRVNWVIGGHRKECRL